jgi:hypothetical protein
MTQSMAMAMIGQECRHRAATDQKLSGSRSCSPFYPFSPAQVNSFCVLLK